MRDPHNTNWLQAPEDPLNQSPLFGPPPQTDGAVDAARNEAAALAALPEPEEMPPYIQDLLELAGVPRTMTAGQILVWTNACQTSSEFEHVEAEVHPEGLWVEFRVQFSTARKLRLRTGRFEEVLAIEDSAGMSGADSTSTASARVALDCARAVGQLLIRH